MPAVGMELRDIQEEVVTKHNPMTVTHEQSDMKSLFCYIMKHIASQI